MLTILMTGRPLLAGTYEARQEDADKSAACYCCSCFPPVIDLISADCKIGREAQSINMFRFFEYSCENITGQVGPWPDRCRRRLNNRRGNAHCIYLHFFSSE